MTRIARMFADRSVRIRSIRVIRVLLGEGRSSTNMAHAVLEEEQTLHMGLPIGNGKLAMWLFLVTEIMFFTGLIGTYIVLRNGSRSWPTPHDVHLKEWI